MPATLSLAWASAKPGARVARAAARTTARRREVRCIDIISPVKNAMKLGAARANSAELGGLFDPQTQSILCAKPWACDRQTGWRCQRTAPQKTTRASDVLPDGLGLKSIAAAGGTSP
ncbi:DUF6647 family protein [Rhodoferax sp.]|uniref:DUF6647 family protein n=1 Tax=Rhodoferax sp. TaxID=50421 RepID=UPI003A0FD26A